MPAFLTGSHAYGNPRPDSDIDLVIFTNEDEHWFLRYNGDAGQKPFEPTRFGRLNLIVLHDVDEFKKWKAVTDELKALKKQGKPVAKEQAKAAFIKAMPQYANRALSDQ